jgi:hypothetical protein
MRKSANRLSLAGKVFGRLTVVAEVEGPSRYSRWKCVCECGTEVEVAGRRLTTTSEPKRSCGCLQREAAGRLRLSHGKSDSRVYHIWEWMKSRCYHQSNPQYHRYGGRGISVCDAWRDSFEAFYADMGDPPSEEHTIERRDVHGNYEPGNCTWATMKEQHRNRGDTAYLTLDGVTKPRVSWAEEFGVHPDTVRSRMQRGWSAEEALKGKT